jgi:rRNA maturation protein Nop10
MDICQREGLHQVDLLSPAPDRISPQEYYAKQRGQQNLDIANMELMIEGITPMHTTFETGKEKIRNAISDIAERATSFEEFQRLLKAEYGISVKDHRGRFSYLPVGDDPDKTQ